MVSKNEIKERSSRAKKLSVYTEEERELAKLLIEQVNKIYVVGWEEKHILEERFLSIIRFNRGNKWKHC